MAVTYVPIVITPEIYPANDGVLLETLVTPTSDEPGSYPGPDAPRSGFVLRVGGSVRWLKVGEGVLYDPTKAAYFGTDRAVIHQRAIISRLPEAMTTSCVNRCSGSRHCTECPSGRFSTPE